MDNQAIYNPLPEDFVKRYDGEVYKIPSREIGYFNKPAADHLKKHLFTAICNHRNLNGIALNANPRLKQAIFDEMEAKVDVEPDSSN